jgi:hypothetical protein
LFFKTLGKISGTETTDKMFKKEVKMVEKEATLFKKAMDKAVAWGKFTLIKLQ